MPGTSGKELGDPMRWVIDCHTHIHLAHVDHVNVARTMCGDSPIMSRVPALLRRLQTYHFASPLPLWNSAHQTRRAGVLIVLTPLGSNDFEVLLTVRTQQLSYAGDAALPGGKAETPDESPLDVAFRESREEVDLDVSKVQFLTYMPGYVSSKLLMVVPSIVWSPKPVEAYAFSTDEVSKVFRMPLSQFLKKEGHSFQEGKLSGGSSIKLDYFHVLATKKKVGDPIYDRVWGLTANILVDCARVVFQKAPEFEQPQTSWEPRPGNMAVLNKLYESGVLQSEYVRKSAI